MNKKQKSYIRPIVYVMISVFLIIGYAYLTSNLTINGASLLKKATWDVHFENVQVKDGSVTGEQVIQEPEIDTNKTTVSFHVNLKKPGDYYEFTVDAVNAGTIDAMINTYTEFDLTEDQLKYLETSVTYEDGEEIAEKQQLLAGDFAVYKIVVSFKKDLEADDLPSAPEQLDLTYTVEYVQKDDTAIERLAESHLLYNILKREAESGSGLAKKYIGEHQDSMDVSKSNKKIYSWNATTFPLSETINDMNNVVFANRCWKILRTTDTGGVKLIYSGMSINNQCLVGRGYHAAYSTDSGKVENLNSDYYYSSDFVFDADTQKFSLSSDKVLMRWSDSSYSNLLEKYTCKSSNPDASCDKLYLIDSYYSSSSAKTFILVSSNIDYTIGSLMFNKDYEKYESVGYMYGNDSRGRSIDYSNSTNTIGSYGYGFISKKTLSSISNDILFADSYIYHTNESPYNKYTMSSPQRFDSFSDTNEIKNKYTLWGNSSSSSSSSINYIIDIIDDNVYYKTLSNGNSLSAYQPLYISNSNPSESNDSYYINNPVEVSLAEWITDYSNYSKKYACIGSNPCTNPIFITSASLTSLANISAKDKITISKSYSGLELIDYVTLSYADLYNNYSNYSDYKYTCGNEDIVCTKDSLKYITGFGAGSVFTYFYFRNHYFGSSISWDGEKYTLNDVIGLEYSNDKSTLSTHHYMCIPATETSCSSVGYIIKYTVNDYYYYITLKNGQTSYSDFFSLYDDNANDSLIKKGIDLWYKKNLIDYSDYLDDTIFCNDRRVFDHYSWDSGDNLVYGYIRFKPSAYNIYPIADEDKIINLKCQRSYDSFSVSNPIAKLEFPIGLIDLSEVRFTGTSAYFFANQAYFWTMSPNYFGQGSTQSAFNAGMFSIPADGNIGNPVQNSMDSGGGVRPVITLKTDTTFSVGNGSKENPYYIGVSYNIDIDNNNFNIKTKAAAGDIVKISSYVYIVNSFKLDGILINGDSFIMPDHDVHITDVDYMNAYYNIENHNVNIVAPNTGRYNTTIKIKSDDDYAVSSFKLDGELINGDSFIMPSHDVVISDVTVANYIIVESDHNPYPNSLDLVYFERTFEGASSINIDLTYQTEGRYLDTIYISKTNDSSWPSEYGGTSLTTQSISLNSNYIKIRFRTNGSYNNYYGFKAVITPIYD